MKNPFVLRCLITYVYNHVETAFNFHIHFTHIVKPKVQIKKKSLGLLPTHHPQLPNCSK